MIDEILVMQEKFGMKTTFIAEKTGISKNRMYHILGMRKVKLSTSEKNKLKKFLEVCNEKNT